MYHYRGRFFGKTPVYLWNSVDVLTESGLFQHGEVINVAETGLMVDFHCNGQRAQLVSYNNALHPSWFPYSLMQQHWYEPLQPNPAATENASVQVLCRPHLGAAWCWYPGRLLRLPFCFPCLQIGLVWVAVDLDGRRLTELFSADQVRFPPSKQQLAQRALSPDYFVVREYRLPDEFWVTLTPKAADDFHRQLELEKGDVRVISILGGAVKYLQRRNAKAVTEKEVQEVRELTEKTSHRVLSDEQDKLGLEVTVIAAATRKRKHPDDDAPPEVECVLPSATHLLLEIFHSLDSVNRQKLRRVCPLWNTVLTGADSVTIVRVSFRLNRFFPRKEEDFTDVYGAVAVLLKCTNGKTQRVIIEDLCAEQLDIAVVVVKRVLRDIRVKQLICHRVEMDWELNYGYEGYEYIDNGAAAAEEVQEKGRIIFRRLAKMLKSMAPHCDELCLQRCEFSSLEKMSVIIPHATVKLDAADIEAQFWDLYEAQLSREGVNLEEMAEWIRTGAKNLRAMVVQYLMVWQSRDPRSTTPYRGHKWTLGNLKDLDVSKLTTLTLRALKERLPLEKI
ncbi:uncharacterized protein LOC129595468 [Paramacrobiotus metropolitanus]|uniref:uncharacterized protein LOC129595468 n=1 Tax=Paramacrobiotus metropolitanus TaxID=2943436 RepID=UPI00244641FC|nr:uncharacterized protein LOC129595468 [Paramacrobiotus metropolitanus]